METEHTASEWQRKSKEKTKQHKILETNEDNTKYQNITSTAKEKESFQLRGNFLAINVYFKKLERHQIRDLIMTSQRYRKISTKASKKKETLKTRDEINKIEVKKSTKES